MARHGGYPMVPEELWDKATSMPCDARDVIERLYEAAGKEPL
jgi:hypothetical protein